MIHYKHLKISIKLINPVIYNLCFLHIFSVVESLKPVLTNIAFKTFFIMKLLFVHKEIST